MILKASKTRLFVYLFKFLWPRYTPDQGLNKGNIPWIKQKRDFIKKV
jgi:hypothetical protein